MHFFNSHEGTAAKRLRARRNITFRIQHDARTMPQKCIFIRRFLWYQFAILIDFYRSSKCSHFHFCRISRFWDYNIHGQIGFLSTSSNTYTNFSVAREIPAPEHLAIC